MKKIILFFIGNITVHAQDLKVFDLKLGEPMNVRECTFQIAESSSKDGISVQKNKNRGLTGAKPYILKMYGFAPKISPKKTNVFNVSVYTIQKVQLPE